MSSIIPPNRQSLCTSECSTQRLATQTEEVSNQEAQPHSHNTQTRQIPQRERTTTGSNKIAQRRSKRLSGMAPCHDNETTNDVTFQANKKSRLAESMEVENVQVKPDDEWLDATPRRISLEANVVIKTPKRPSKFMHNRSF